MHAKKRIRKAVFPSPVSAPASCPPPRRCPKEMLTVVDRPVIQHVVDEAGPPASSISSSSPAATRRVIEDHFDIAVRARRHAGRARQDEGARRRCRRPACRRATASFTRQQAPLGLGHAVWCARDIVGDEPFALLLPDMLHHRRGTGCLAGDDRRLRRSMAATTSRSRRCPTDQTHQYGIVGVEDRARPRSREITGDGRKAGARDGALEPAHHRPLHPAADDLRPSRQAGEAAPAARSSSPTR